MDTRLRRLVAGVGVALAARVAAVALGGRAFTRAVHDDVQHLLREVPRQEKRLVGEDQLDGLPEPVQRYLRYTEVVGTPFVRTVQLRQRGRMLLGPGQLWIPLTAQQWHSVHPPGFVWDATLRLGPVPIVRARDTYRAGSGNMLIKAAAVVTVADATGMELDQGEMMRYLNEIMWFPSAFLEDNITFQAVDSSSARVTLTDHGQSVTATLFFDPDGRLTEIVGQRYSGGGLETWSVPVTGYGEFEGLRLPSRAKAVWRHAQGDEEYIDVTITDLHHHA
jgi:hypothetical protein